MSTQPSTIATRVRRLTQTDTYFIRANPGTFSQNTVPVQWTVRATCTSLSDPAEDTWGERTVDMHAAEDPFAL